MKLIRTIFVATMSIPKPNIVLFGANGKVGKRVLLGLLQQAYLADVKSEGSSADATITPTNSFRVQAVVRSRDRMVQVPPEYDPYLEIVEASILHSDDAPKIHQLVQNAQTTVSCLGHGKNVFAKEQANLLLDSTKMLFGALTPTNRLICLNGAAARHPDGRESNRGWIEWVVLSLLSWIVPAHADMERTLEYLYNEQQQQQLATKSGKHWIVVRPGLFKEDEDDSAKGTKPPTKIPPYSLTQHRDVGLFSGRVCSVSNVADSIVKMAINENNLQVDWDHCMPVVLDDVAA